LTPQLVHLRRFGHRLLVTGAAVVGLVALGPGVSGATAAPAPGTNASSADRIPLTNGATAPGIPPFGDFRGAPPDVRLPTGGKATLSPAKIFGGEPVVSLLRAHGTLYARGTLSGQDTYADVELYDGSGRLYYVMSAYRAELNSQPGAKRRLSPTSRKPAQPVGSKNVKRLNATCGSQGGQYSDRGYRVPVPFNWYMNIASMPQAYWNSVFYAADNWNSLQNWCNTADQSTLAVNYVDQTSRYWAQDGVSVVDFRPTVELGGVCADSVGCAQAYVSGGVVVEGDARFDSFRAWNYTGGPVSSSAYDVEGTMTHEFGHIVGLDHVGTSNEVMYTFAVMGRTSDRKLGRGDSNFANLAY